MNVFLGARLSFIENRLVLVGFLLVTMEAYEESEASGKDANRSAVYGLLGEMNCRLRKAVKSLVMQLMRQMKMKSINGAVFDIVKSPDGCESVGFKVSVDGGKKWMCFLL